MKDGVRVKRARSTEGCSRVACGVTVAWLGGVPWMSPLDAESRTAPSNSMRVHVQKGAHSLDLSGTYLRGNTLLEATEDSRI